MENSRFTVEMILIRIVFPAARDRRRWLEPADRAMFGEKRFRESVFIKQVLNLFEFQVKLNFSAAPEKSCEIVSSVKQSLNEKGKGKLELIIN